MIGLRTIDREYVFLAAAKVGGIVANRDYQGQFIYDNLMIQTNVIHCAHRHLCKKLVFLGSSCIYPKHAAIPIKESSLMTGQLEPTNDAYAIAKIAGIKMCQAYRQQYKFNAIALMPSNLYGPFDNFDLESSHVLAAMIRKFHEAKVNDTEVILWGDGSPLREFLYVDDLADACLFLMHRYNDCDHINVGSGKDISIRDLAALMVHIVQYDGRIVWDDSKPNGTHRKLMDNSRLATMGWSPRTDMEEGIRRCYAWFVDNAVV